VVNYLLCFDVGMLGFDLEKKKKKKRHVVELSDVVIVTEWVKPRSRAYLMWNWRCPAMNWENRLLVPDPPVEIEK
jgi:hypothetical protein